MDKPVISDWYMVIGCGIRGGITMVFIASSLTNQQIEAFRDQIVRIYRDAFSASPYRKGEEEVAAPEEEEVVEVTVDYWVER